jgi:hypothetical protein
VYRADRYFVAEPRQLRFHELAQMRLIIDEENAEFQLGERVHGSSLYLSLSPNLCHLPLEGGGRRAPRRVGVVRDYTQSLLTPSP